MDIVSPLSLSGHLMEISRVVVPVCEPIVPRALLLMGFLFGEKLFKGSFKFVNFLRAIRDILHFKVNIHAVLSVFNVLGQSPDSGFGPFAELVRKDT